MMDIRFNLCLVAILFLFIVWHGIASVILAAAVMAAAILLIVGFMSLYKKANS